MLLHLHDSISFRSFHLHWVPHLLMHDLREKWKDYAKAMIPFLHVVKHDSWHHLVTGDESWFSLNTSLRRMLILSRDDVVTKSRLDIQNERFKFTFIWNPGGFYVIDKFPNDTKMNNDYFVTNIIIPLEQAIFLWGRELYQKWLVVHLDNYSVHTSRASTDWFEEHGMRIMLCPRYSQIWPSDLYLFSTVKENSNKFRWLTSISLLSPCKRFRGILIKKNWRVYFKLGWNRFKK
jgi:hypothetical protein